MKPIRAPTITMSSRIISIFSLITIIASTASLLGLFKFSVVIQLCIFFSFISTLSITTYIYPFSKSAHADIKNDGTRSTIATIITLYISYIFIFAALYNTIEPETFVNNKAHYAATGSHVIDRAANALYFSAATMTTIGYGDITIKTTAAKISVILQALLQIYLATITISTIISHNITTKRHRRHNKASELS